MTEDEIAKEMKSLIRIAPRSWKDLLQQFHVSIIATSIAHSDNCVLGSAAS